MQLFVRTSLDCPLAQNAEQRYVWQSNEICQILWSNETDFWPKHRNRNKAPPKKDEILAEPKFGPNHFFGRNTLFRP